MAELSFIGIDVSKSTLDVHILPQGKHMQVTNDNAGLTRLTAILTKQTTGLCVFEATGHYSRDLHNALSAAKLPVSCVNPRQASFYIKSITPSHKTDKSDAAALAHMAKNMDLPETLPPTALEQALQEFVNTKLDFTAQKTAAKNRLQSLISPLLIKQTRLLIVQLESNIAQIDTEIEALIKADSTLRKKAAILETIPGIGKASAFAILALMPEIGTLNEKQVASLLGVAPIARDSGTFKGKRYCRGGRGTLRSLLYLPTLTATRSNKILHEFYIRLRKNGKSHKTALIASMRKLIIYANSLVKNDDKWDYSLDS